MNLTDAIELIRFDAEKTPAKWADLGCGKGLFSHALAHLLAPESTVFALDKSMPAFGFSGNEKSIKLIKQEADFVKDELHFPLLDGILMANSFHYVEDKTGLLGKLKPYLKTDGRMLFVEYDTDMANPWVPYPLKTAELQLLLVSCGFTSCKKLQERPSVYGRANLYSMLAEQNRA